MKAPKNLSDFFTVARYKILIAGSELGTYTSASEAWRRYDVLLLAGVDVTLEVVLVPAVL
jgi:hypothetical protein